jgi:hypothetical protein
MVLDITGQVNGITHLIWREDTNFIRCNDYISIYLVRYHNAFLFAHGGVSCTITHNVLLYIYLKNRIKIKPRIYTTDLLQNIIRVITKLPNSEQSSKRKVKTHMYVDRQNQSTTGKLWKPYWPWLGTGISKEMVSWIRF